MTVRYTKISLPGYMFVPNMLPHPKKKLDVVHIPELPDDTINFSVNNWQKSKRYLYAIDLFNHGYYWEVHEVLEQIWMSVGKKSPEGTFIQGLIQLAVAFLKYSQKNYVGVERLRKKALPRILSQKGIYLGIDINKFMNEFEFYINEKLKTCPKIILKFD